MKQSQVLSLGFATLACTLLAACGGGGGGGAETPQPARGELRSTAQIALTLPAAGIDAETAQTGLQALSGPARCNVSIVPLDFHTPAPAGEMTNSTGVLLLPSGSDPACQGPHPLAVMSKGSESTRFPSVADPKHRYTGLVIAMLASQGYAVVSADMLGYAGSSLGFSPYLHADSAATTTIDSIRAARAAARALGATLSDGLLLSGYSQGGHTTAATMRAIEREAKGEFHVLAASLQSPPLDLEASVRSPDAVIGYQDFATMLIVGYQKVYGNIYTAPGEVFRPPYAQDIENILPAMDYAAVIAAGRLPALPDPTANRDLLLQPAFIDAVRHDDANPLVQAARANSLLGWMPQSPTLVCYGSKDQTVPSALHSEAFAAAISASGVAHVSFVDVDQQVTELFTHGAPLPDDPVAAYAARASYHDTFVPPLCMVATRQFFDQLR